MDTFFIKIAGKVNVPLKIDIGHNYKLVMDCSVTKEEKEDNEDGTFSIISKVVPITAEISKDNGAVVKARDPRKNSTKIRNVLWAVWKDKNNETDFEQVYNRATNWIVRNAELIIDQSNDQARKT